MSNRKTRSAGDQPLLIPGIISPKEAFRNIRNYLAGQFVGATRDDALLDEVLKCLFCKLYMETSSVAPLRDDADTFEQSRQVRSVFAKVRCDFPDIYDQNTEILLDPEAVAFVMRECQFSLLDAATDPIGDAFEVFVGAESRGRSGQFFTPRSVTDFLVKALDPQPAEKVVDPACGAGGFLTSVVRHHAARGVALTELADIAERNLYGIDKDDYLVRLARLHVSLLTRGHPKILCADSIAMQTADGDLLRHLPQGGFDVLLTNPPFGVRIVAAKPDILRTFSLARKWRLDRRSNKWAPSTEIRSQVPPQVLFVERCLSLLKEGGRMGIVLPESVLSNKSYRYVTEYILSNAEVQAVIGMPESLFKTSGKGGTHTKTCLLVARKTRAKARRHTIFMAEAKWCGHDSRARAIPHNDLPRIAEAYSRFKNGEHVDPSPLGFIVSHDELVGNVLCPRYYDPQLTAVLRSLAPSHDLLLFGDLVKRGILSVSTGDELGKLAYGTGDIPFIRTSDISNWELKADPKHGVDRKIYESMRHRQDVQAGDLLMVKDGTYLIGTCAMITERDTEIVYQSHLFKIRVNQNEVGLNPYLLLAVLSSPIVQRQIRAKQFTQDIIDSLGERIGELVLPVPKSDEVRQRISSMVERAVRMKLEARELARRARIEVQGCDLSDPA